MTNFQEKLKQLMDEYVHFVYDETRNFPQEEKYSSVSQWRRSTLSIILNYLEGYARRKLSVQLNFMRQLMLLSTNQNIYFILLIKENL